jgi:hypothetical protein
MEKHLDLDTMPKALSSRVVDKDNKGLLNNRKHLVSTKKEISMDFTPSSHRVRNKIGLISQALNTMTNQTFMEPRIRAVRTNMLTLILITLEQARLEPKKNKNNNKKKVSDGILETPTHGSGTKMTVKSSIQERLVRIRVIKSKKIGKTGCHRMNKRTTRSTLKSLRGPGVRLSSMLPNFNSSKTTDTTLGPKLRRKQREKPTTRSLKRIKTLTSTPLTEDSVQPNLMATCTRPCSGISIHFRFKTREKRPSTTRNSKTPKSGLTVNLKRQCNARKLL